MIDADATVAALTVRADRTALLLDFDGSLAPIVERPEGLLIRTSTHFYNTVEEIDQLAEVLPGLIRRASTKALQ